MEKARQHTALTRRAPGLAKACLLAVALAGAAAAAMAGETPIEVPSGQEVTFLDTIRGAPGTEGLTVRFRFVAPAIARVGGTVTAEEAQADMQALCDSYALPRIASTGPQPAQIIISLADRPVPFGEPDPDATQFFEAYSIVDGACMWEAF